MNYLTTKIGLWKSDSYPGNGLNFIPIEFSDFVINTTAERRHSEYDRSIHGNIIFKSDETHTGKLKEIPSGLAVNGKVMLKKTVKAGKWYPIGFPFELSAVYCDAFKDDSEGPYLTVHKETVGVVGDYWLKSYDGNAFQYADTIRAHQGYIIQFPTVFDDVEVSFISEDQLTLYNTTAPHSPLATGYSLSVNPSVHQISAIGGTDFYYKYEYDNNNTYVADNNHFGLLKGANASNIALKPFEAIITVTGVEQSQLRSTIGIDSTTGVLPTGSESNDPVIALKYYTLQGVEIPQPVKGGIYLVKKIHLSKKTVTSKELVFTL
jgi:hypothetical protein